MNKAFTLLELVFVILILGILSSLSLSFINTTKDEVKILKLKMDYEMLSSALALMRSQMRLKNLNFPEILDNAQNNQASITQTKSSYKFENLSSVTGLSKCFKKSSLISKFLFIF